MTRTQEYPDSDPEPAFPDEQEDADYASETEEFASEQDTATPDDTAFPDMSWYELRKSNWKRTTEYPGEMGRKKHRLASADRDAQAGSTKA